MSQHLGQSSKSQRVALHRGAGHLILFPVGSVLWIAGERDRGEMGEFLTVRQSTEGSQKRLRPPRHRQLTEVFPRLFAAQFGIRALAKLQCSSPNLESVLPALAVHNIDALGAFLARMNPDHVDVTWHSILIGTSVFTRSVAPKERPSLAGARQPPEPVPAMPGSRFGKAVAAEELNQHQGQRPVASQLRVK
jgi:hypothetical protein